MNDITDWGEVGFITHSTLHFQYHHPYGVVVLEIQHAPVAQIEKLIDCKATPTPYYISNTTTHMGWWYWKNSTRPLLRYSVRLASNNCMSFIDSEKFNLQYYKARIIHYYISWHWMFNTPPTFRIVVRR